MSAIVAPLNVDNAADWAPDDWQDVHGQAPAAAPAFTGCVFCGAPARDTLDAIRDAGAKLAGAIAFLDGVRKCHGAALVLSTPIDEVERDALRVVESLARDLARAVMA